MAGALAAAALCYGPRVLQRAPIPPDPRGPGGPRGPRRPPTARTFSIPRASLLLFAVALALRVAYVWLALGPDATPSSDAVSYDTVAWNLARGVGFHLNGAAGSYPTAFVPPVLPFVTSLLYRVVGHQFFAALLLQAVLGALVPLVVAALGTAVFGGAPGRLAGWLAALHPLLVFFSGYLLTETTFTLALLLAVFASMEWLKTPRPGRALGAGLLWGVAALTRPTALPLPLVVAAWAWAPLGLTVMPRERVRQLAMLALGVVLVVAPWTIRNAIELRAFVPVTTGGGRSLLDANNAIVWDDPALRGGATSVIGIEPYASRFRGLSEAEVDRVSGAMAREFMLSRMHDWPAVKLAKLARFWRLTAESGSTGSWQRGDSSLGALLRVVDPLLVWSLVVLPFAIAGLVTTLRGPRRLFQSLPALVILAFTFGAIVYWGALRLRVPIEPYVVLYAAVGANEAWKAWRVRRAGLRLVERPAA